MKKFLLCIGIVILLFTFGCNTGVVPPGNVVIITKTNGDTSIIKSGKYTSWGRDRVYFVDMRLKAFTEKMKILCADDINMAVDVKWLGSFDVSNQMMEVIKTQVPSESVKVDDNEVRLLSLPKFYKIAMKDIIRSNSRDVVQPYITDNIPSNRKQITAAIKKLVIQRFKALGFPIKTSDILLSNLDYPPEVTKQRKAIKKAMLKDEEEAALAEARIAKSVREEEIARWEGKGQIVRAQTAAAENMIISASITPAILANKQWDTIAAMANSQNNQVFVLPYEALKNTGITAGILNKQALDKLIAATAPLTIEEKEAKAKEAQKIAAKFKQDAAERKAKYNKKK